MDSSTTLLTFVDYIVLLVVLLASAMIGLYFRYSGGKQQTAEEYLQAGRNMNILPVSFSLMATYMSTSTLMGVPAEVYAYGTTYSFSVIGLALGMMTAAFVFLPVYFNAQVSTTYEYLEKRFGPFARTACSIGFAIQATLFMSVVLYTPALALSAVTNLSTWTSVISIGVICTFYCTIGGMKAVIWTDVFQATLMFICLLSIITKGAMEFGGISKIFEIGLNGGRLRLPSFSTSISVRYTAWNTILIGFIMGFSAYGTSQLHVQRLLAVRNILKSQLSVLASLPITVAFFLLCSLSGLVFYAAFQNCDPLHSPENIIFSEDQIMPYFIMKHLKDYPGLPGLCICGIFAASLSTVSSIIQSLTVVTMKDLFHPFCCSYGKSEKNLTLLAKTITLFYGMLAVLLSFLVATFGNIAKATITLFNVMGGPLLGLFLLAVLTTTANEKGAILGMVFSFILGVWLTFGPFTYIPDELPFSVEGCSVFASNDTSTYFKTNSNGNETLAAYTTAEFEMNDVLLSDKIENSFQMSYMWVTPIGAATCIVLGYVLSLLVDYFTGQKKVIPSEFSSPLLLWVQRNIFGVSQLHEKHKTKEELEMQQTKL